MSGEVRHEARRARRNVAVRAAARSGYVAQALLRLLIAALAIALATRHPAASADAAGAFALVARAPGGVLLLAVVAAGELALFAWLVVSCLLVRGRDLSAWRRRAVHLGRAVVHGFVGVLAARVALGARASSAQTDRTTSAHLLSVPGGSVVLGAIGVVVVITGIGLGWRGLTTRFRSTIRLPAAAWRRRLVVGVGVVGYVGRGITIAVAGVLVVVAASTLDPSRAAGLSAAFGGVATSPPGRVALVALAVGWLAAAAYGVARAVLARLDR